MKANFRFKDLNCFFNKNFTRVVLKLIKRNSPMFLYIFHTFKLHSEEKRASLTWLTLLLALLEPASEEVKAWLICGPRPAVEPL